MNNHELISQISQDLGLSPPEIRKILPSAPFRYKHYQIKKRDGGLRDIYHPTPELKEIQRWIANNILNKLPVHHAVFSYREGRGIRNHADLHRTSRYFLRFDFKNFFPSIKFNDIVVLLRNAQKQQLISVDDTAAVMIAWLLCRAPKGARANTESLALSIGAPSSPAVSNAILYELDARFAELAREHSAQYSRYADDLFFSSKEPHVISVLSKSVVAIVNSSTTPKLTINDKKTSSVSKKHRVKITGVIVTSDNKLSVGRIQKRTIRAHIHKHISSKLPPAEAASLRGMIAYVRSIEPDFVERLKKKYGAERIAALLSNH